jgi:hypothetical protein
MSKGYDLSALVRYLQRTGNCLGNPNLGNLNITYIECIVVVFYVWKLSSYPSYHMFSIKVDCSGKSLRVLREI